MPQTTPVGCKDSASVFSFPAVRGKTVTAAFDGDSLTSDGGVLVLAIACGYEDADDLDALRDDPGFRLALGKLPEAGAGLASQPTMSRWENAPTTREVAKMLAALIDIYCGSYPAPPAAAVLDIDDTCDVVHGYQQLSFWNGHYGERCFLLIHVCDTAPAGRWRSC